ncbi:MAG: carotenoid oxygenase [Alphaproteobacteria bacterium]|nr:MAG: carotenoid oxygenase [Alphaproteobacteria bacterium]PZO41626.1 MAG: carotenoid oxygenase [Alphaproteobacteria bacterium]
MALSPRYPDTVHYTGLNRPTHIEATAHDLYVEGDIPGEIEGTFFRALHDPAHVPLREEDVVLSRDGVIGKIEFRDGKVNCAVRYVRTERFLAEQKAGRALFGLYRNPFTDDPLAAGVDRTVANTTPYYHAGRLFMSKEDGLPYRINPDTLETIGRWDYHGTLKSPTLTAHPKIDPDTGELFLFGYEAAGLATPTVAYCVISPEGELISEQWFDAPYCSMMHDFAITPDHAIFTVYPTKADLDRLKAGGVHWIHDPQDYSYIGIMPRYGKVEEIVWFKGPRGVHSYHVMNAFSEGSKVHLDQCMADRNLIPFISEDSGLDPFAQGGLTRWTMDLAQPEAGITEWQIGPFGEMPLIAHRDTGKPYSRGWYLSVDPTKLTRLANGPGEYVFNQLVRVSFPDGGLEVFSEGPGCGFNEPVHIPSQDPAHGGWLMLMVDWIVAEGYFAQQVWIFEADDIAKGPIAKVLMPFVTCEQVHGTWVPRARLDQAREI